MEYENETDDEMHRRCMNNVAAFLSELNDPNLGEGRNSSVLNPTLTRVDCVAYNRDGKVIFEETLPEVEFLKIFKDLFDHVERINKGHAFRVW